MSPRSVRIDDQARRSSGSRICVDFRKCLDSCDNFWSSDCQIKSLANYHLNDRLHCCSSCQFWRRAAIQESGYWLWLVSSFWQSQQVVAPVPQCGVDATSVVPLALLQRIDLSSVSDRCRNIARQWPVDRPCSNDVTRCRAHDQWNESSGVVGSKAVMAESTKESVAAV